MDTIELLKNLLVDVPGKTAVLRWWNFFCDIKGINQFKGMIRGVKTLVVDDQMTIVTNLNFFVGQPGQALDVEQILLKVFDVFCFKNDNFSTVGFAEIIGQPVDQQVIPRLSAHLDNVIS